MIALTTCGFSRGLSQCGCSGDNELDIYDYEYQYMDEFYADEEELEEENEEE